ncbi:MAG: hypothetical protein ACLUR5_10915 [Eubacterium ventriosum]
MYEEPVKVTTALPTTTQAPRNSKDQQKKLQQWHQQKSYNGSTNNSCSYYKDR